MEIWKPWTRRKQTTRVGFSNIAVDVRFQKRNLYYPYIRDIYTSMLDLQILQLMSAFKNEIYITQIFVIYIFPCCKKYIYFQISTLLTDCVRPPRDFIGK